VSVTATPPRSSSRRTAPTGSGYLVDGERRQNDWAADSYAPNEYGGDDSVLDLTGSRTSADTNGRRRAG
jgi:hypothetical protein